ncbi:MAG: hypothetical protein CMM05_07530 [Rhodopirellula sp.]|nr:hypothetical protein [Rhodopirellula sp.]|tara:strand:- start:108 stop:395 length:288 start_codon:yes stop_codon:yes gene_type:complete
MTQMLLFDAPADAAILPVTESFQAESVVAGNAVTGNGVVERSVPVKRSNVAAKNDREGGVHHMGDLARLVLLRYDVVAKRRAVMAARRATRRVAR